MDSPQGITALSGVLLALVTSTVGLRFYARSLQKMRPGPDDWTVIPAYIAFAAVCGIVFASVHLKLMAYPKGVSKEPARIGSALDTSFLVLDDLCLGLTKISALFFYKRIFVVSDRQRVLKNVLNASVVFISLWTVVYIVLPPLQCQGHFAAGWDPILKKKYCTITIPFVYSNAITDVILEAYVIALPIPLIWRIRTSLGRRLAILFIFLTALASLGGSLARLTLIFMIAQHKISGDGNLLDTKLFFIWILETGFALLAINIPTLHSLVVNRASTGFFLTVRNVLSFSSLRSGSTRDNAPCQKGSTATEARAGPRYADLENANFSVDTVSGKGAKHDSSIVAVREVVNDTDLAPSSDAIEIVRDPL